MDKRSEKNFLEDDPIKFSFKETSGAIGILYALIKAIKVVTKLYMDEEIMRVVKRAMDDIVTCISTFDGMMPDAKGQMSF
jgi:rhamnogalacturonyl hydrolase YesR